MDSPGFFWSAYYFMRAVWINEAIYVTISGAQGARR